MIFVIFFNSRSFSDLHSSAKSYLQIQLSSVRIKLSARQIASTVQFQLQRISAGVVVSLTE